MNKQFIVNLCYCECASFSALAICIFFGMPWASRWLMRIGWTMLIIEALELAVMVFVLDIHKAVNEEMGEDDSDEEVWWVDALWWSANQVAFIALQQWAYVALRGACIVIGVLRGYCTTKD